MTPAARIAAAIDVLDRIGDGVPAERALLSWSRGARYAGSKDRAAVRDHVFDVLRRWWSSAAWGGGETGRHRMIGRLREAGADLSEIFTGQGHAPSPMAPGEAEGTPPTGAAALDLPPWLVPQLRTDHGTDLEGIAEALRQRAPVFLRVNSRFTDLDRAVSDLADHGIVARPHPLSATALEVIEGARAIRSCPPYTDGRVDLQDAASQAITDSLPLAGTGRILDFCAGGGGKTLAMAARHDATYHVHDADPGRMADLPARAARAGVDTAPMDPDSTYDLVLADAPCSGSGAWRRSPGGKISFDSRALRELSAKQDAVLEQAAPRVVPGGCLAYVTCSILSAENSAPVERFLDRHGAFGLIGGAELTPLDGGDGFFLALMRRQGG